MLSDAKSMFSISYLISYLSHESLSDILYNDFESQCDEKDMSENKLIMNKVFFKHTDA